MNNSTIVFLINDHVRAMRGSYETGSGAKAELFKTLDPTIKVDDLVVVQSGTRHEMTVVKITEEDVEFDLDTATPIPWIVQRIDSEAFADVLAQEGEAISAVQSAERKRKKDALRAAVFADQTDRIDALRLANHSDADEAVTD